MGHVGGAVVLEAMLGAVGYAFIWPLLRERSVAARLSYAGVAVVAGTSACAAAGEIAAVAGARTGLLVVCLLAAALAVLGLALGLVLRPRAVTGRATEERPPPSRLEELCALVAGTLVCAIAAGILYGGSRSTPWLDDSWFFWVPKGIVLDKLGLDPRLFVPNHTFSWLTNPDYPLGWSILLNTGLRLAGRIDLRTANAELAILTVAFLGAAARLLWSLVRPVFALSALALLALSPEFERQALGGGADLTVAYLVTLFSLAATAWLVRGERVGLVLAGLFAAGALATKNEAAPELLAVVVVLALAAWRPARGRLLALGAACSAAVATAVPWLAWRQAHGVQSDVSLGRAFDVAYLAHRASRAGAAWSTISHNIFDPQSWLVIVPLVILLTLLAVVLERRVLVLAPLAVVAATTAILVWVYWADPLDIGYLLGTSAYRTIDTIMLLAALGSAGLADRIARRLTTRRPAGPG